MCDEDDDDDDDDCSDSDPCWFKPQNSELIDHPLKIKSNSLSTLSHDLTISVSLFETLQHNPYAHPIKIFQEQSAISICIANDLENGGKKSWGEIKPTLKWFLFHGCKLHPGKWTAGT